MSDNARFYGPFGTAWAVDEYNAGMGAPAVVTVPREVAEAYAPIEEGMLWLTDTEFGGRGVFPTVSGTARKPSVAVSGPSTPWDVGSPSTLRQGSGPLADSGQAPSALRQSLGPLAGSGQAFGEIQKVSPESVFTEGEQNELVENMAGQISLARRLESARTQGVRDAEAETLWEQLMRRQGELRQSGERRAGLRNTLMDEMGNGAHAAQPSVAMAGGGLGRELEPREANAQAGGGMGMNQNLSRTYTDSEADELIKIMLDTRRVAALDDRNDPRPEVGAKLAELEGRRRQINAAADARAAGMVGTYGQGVADVPLYGTEMGMAGELGQPAAGRMLTGRDIELGGYNGKGPKLPSETKPLEFFTDDGVLITLPDMSRRTEQAPARPTGQQNDWADGGKLFARNLADAPVSMLQGAYNEATAVVGDPEWSLNPLEWQRLAELRGFRDFMTKKPDPEIAQWMPDPRQIPGDPLTKVENEIAALEKKASDAYRGSLREHVAGAYGDEAEKLGSQRDLYRRYYNVDEDYEQSFLGKVIAGGGQMIPQAVVAQLRGIGPVLLQSQAYQQALDDARETAARTGQPYDEKKAREYAFASAFQGMLLDWANVDGTVGRWLKEGGESTLRSALTHVMAGTATGMVTNPLQGALSDMQATQKGIEERNWFDPERRRDDVLLGLATNGPISLGLAGARGVDHYNSFEQRVRREADAIDGGKAQFGNINGDSLGMGSEGTVPNRDRRRATTQRAIDWLRMFKTIAPGAARELELKIAARHEAEKRMAGIESALTGRRVEYGVPGDAHAAIHRDTIYLFEEALSEYRRNGNELSEGIRRIQHEVGHKWWTALSDKERSALTQLWKAETGRKKGPLYDAEGRLKPEVMAGVESDVQEWFGERAAMANDEWAQKRAAIADHDGSPIGRAAAALRGWLFDARQAIAPNLSRDVIADELRGVLRRGTRGGYSYMAFAIDSGKSLQEIERSLPSLRIGGRQLRFHAPVDEIRRKAKAAFDAWPEHLEDLEGRSIILRHNKQGREEILFEHLVSDDRGGPEFNGIRASWIPLVPYTIEHAKIKLDAGRDGGGHKKWFYVAKYDNGFRHLVLVREGEGVVGHAAMNDELWTQFSQRIGNINTYSGMRAYLLEPGLVTTKLVGENRKENISLEKDGKSEMGKNPAELSPLRQAEKTLDSLKGQRKELLGRIVATTPSSEIGQELRKKLREMNAKIAEFEVKLRLLKEL